MARPKYQGRIDDVVERASSEARARDQRIGHRLVAARVVSHAQRDGALGAKCAPVCQLDEAVVARGEQIVAVQEERVDAVRVRVAMAFEAAGAQVAEDNPAVGAACDHLTRARDDL